MKKNILIFILIIGSFYSCNQEKNTVNTKQYDGKSAIYKETILATGGDFLGMHLGNSFETIANILPKELLTIEENELMYYNKPATFSDSEYQLFFKDNKLEEINFDSYIKNEQGEIDKDRALILFNDIKKDFLKKFGNKYMESSDEVNEILYWSNEEKNIQLIFEFQKAAVHVYLDMSIVEEI